MKVKRYFAKDMRQALRLVRDEQGPDAVILSTEKVNDGVEIVAAIDYDAEPAPAPVESRTRAVNTDFAQELATNTRREREEEPVIGSERANMGDELRTLRRMLETQLATLAWNDLTRRAPVQTELLKELTSFGLAQDLAAELVTQLPARLEFSEAHRYALALLSRRIEVREERWLDHGGVVAFVGPTGVGKTTLIAKLAARWVLRHGPNSLALISADAVRIGAADQIHTLGRLLGVPAYAVEGARDLAPTLRSLKDSRLVLIDTAGLSQRDPRLAAELNLLTSAHARMETCLVLSASAQAGAIEESVTRFAPAAAASCVITKVDEATSLGGIISTLIRSRLPLAYVSEGQRVPEDLNPARAHQLIARAVDLARKSGATPDEDLLQRRFGGVAHALA
ncbi:MAG TPA: flagellar biosynthesis protein FlhF [Steroidobacteraceae bacterium]|nr:flagellar biosynthesis protein FlhF [Steroidobacteraceae bacterium]